MPKAKQKKHTSMRAFAKFYESETGFDLMDRDGRSEREHARHNIQWFRDWAQETVQRLEREADKLRPTRDEAPQAPHG